MYQEMKLIWETGVVLPTSKSSHGYFVNFAGFGVG